MNDNKPITLNEKELLEYYNLHGTAGKALLRFKFLKNATTSINIIITKLKIENKLPYLV